MTSKEALEELRCILVSNQDTKRYSDIFEENLLQPIEKDLEVLEIIKNKDVRIRVLLASKNVEEYNYSILFEIQHLTQEEFDLLKEWLSNE